jgi:uncharacterized cupredoxin-like copper-binding protein
MMESTLPACYARTPFMHSTPEMRARIAAAAVEPRRLPVAPLGRLTIGALLAIVALFAVLMGVMIHEVIPPIVGMGVAALAIAAAIAAGWRWAPALGALFAAAVVAMYWPIMSYDLRHPEELSFFAFMVTFLLCAALAVTAGVGATVQNYRAAAGARRVPRWLSGGLATAVGLAGGAILVAAAPRGAAAGVTPEVLASLPAVTTVNFKFDQEEIRVKSGETVALRLENHDHGPHSFDIDSLGVHVYMPTGKPGLALFRAPRPGTYTFRCAIPGHTEGGMVGALIVEE